MTMTTVGFGDLSAKSYFGQNSMLVATAFGVIFEGMFLIAWARHCAMTAGQSEAYVLYNRCTTKRKMQDVIAEKFTALRRMQLIHRDKEAKIKSGQIKREEAHLFRAAELRALQKHSTELMQTYKIKCMRYNEMLGNDAYRKQGFTEYLNMKIDAFAVFLAEKRKIEEGIRRKLLLLQSKQAQFQVLQDLIVHLQKIDNMIIEHKDYLRDRLILRRKSF